MLDFRVETETGVEGAWPFLKFCVLVPEGHRSSVDHGPVHEQSESDAVEPLSKHQGQTGKCPWIAGRWLSSAPFKAGHTLAPQKGKNVAIVIAQHNEKILAICAYLNDRNQEVQWSAKGTITPTGDVVMTYVRTSPDQQTQDHKGKLSPDGKTIKGHSTWNGGENDFTWVLQKPIGRSELYPDAIEGTNELDEKGAKVAKNTGISSQLQHPKKSKAHRSKAQEIKKAQNGTSRSAADAHIKDLLRLGVLQEATFLREEARQFCRDTDGMAFTEDGRIRAVFYRVKYGSVSVGSNGKERDAFVVVYRDDNGLWQVSCDTKMLPNLLFDP